MPEPGHQPREKNWLNLEQVDTVLEVVIDDLMMHALMLTGIHTGLRPGEIRVLRWEDIDFDRQILYEIRYLKTGTSRRGIPMSDDLVVARKALQVVTSTPLVFTYEGGKQLTKDALSWRVGTVFRKAGLPYRDPYVMRHTFASIMDHNKVRHQDIADMGHANVKTFETVYRHMLYPEVNQTSDLMNNVFGKRPAA